MAKRESLNVFEAIDGYYASQEDREPEIKRVWVENHIERLASGGMTSDGLIIVWDDINAFAMFIEDIGHRDLSSLPHWQYSAFVQWAAEHIDEPGYCLRLEHVRRLMGNLRGFFEFLVDSAHLPNLREISSACDYICGRDEVRLIELLSYSGSEHWVTAKASFHQGRVVREVAFSVSDYWLLLLLFSTGGSWGHLRKLASTVHTRSGGTRKLALYNLRRKLRRIGYEKKPEDLLMLSDPMDDREMDRATRWFFRS